MCPCYRLLRVRFVCSFVRLEDLVVVRTISEWKTTSVREVGSVVGAASAFLGISKDGPFCESSGNDETMKRTRNERENYYV